MSRTLPEKRNPLIAEDVAPNRDELLERRRLGRTRLSVKSTLVGTTNATKQENLGPVEYAHLRAPLPEDLSSSEIFAPQPGQPHPQTYFLMRRSKDGFVSATGMFKIAFPWAQHAEERAERDYLKTLESTSTDDVAGNVWIAPEFALDLADDYGLRHWIEALLDPMDIQSSPTSSRKNIAEPPKFDFSSSIKDVKLSPPPTVSKRGRGARASSPSKSTPIPAKATSPKKKRQTKKEKEANNAFANAASASLQSALDDALSIAEGTPAPESVTNDVEEDEGLALDVDGEAPAEDHEDSKVHVEVDQEAEVNGDTEMTHTNVTVEMPVGLPDLPLPEDTEAMLEKAKQMVEEAKTLEGSPIAKSTRKRKVEEVEPSDIDTELPVQPAKRAKVLEEKYKRERVRTRAVFGVAASLAVAAVIPYLQSLL
ncbi:hypothetical protein PMZ80_009519 [Knufia obscura]|uniref:Cell pattern formation-associated protein stuA n=1 Tax=Knufia obscura TaxID=1635080 RepID=A0ABR0RD54_9EURO|nr:hypothetical protein PMZ80_009519 [Knufia obscura]